MVQEYPLASVEFSSMEMSELALSLFTGKLDLIITDYFLKLPGREEVKIGREQFVLIESAKHSDIPGIFLDHGSGDNSSAEFVKFQKMEHHGRCCSWSGTSCYVSSFNSE